MGARQEEGRAESWFVPAGVGFLPCGKTGRKCFFAGWKVGRNESCVGRKVYWAFFAYSLNFVPLLDLFRPGFLASEGAIWAFSGIFFHFVPFLAFASFPDIR